MNSQIVWTSALLLAGMLVPSATSVAEEWRLEYSATRKQERRSPADGKEAPQTAPFELIVRLGADRFSVRQEDQRTVYDFDEKRIVTLDLEDRVYSSRSLYSEIAFRAAELRNRTRLRRLLKKAGTKQGDQPFGDRFELETLFSLTLPGGERAADIKTDSEGKTLAFRRDEDVVVRFTHSESELPEAQRKMLSRFLIYGCRIHPEIRRQIEKPGRAPEMLAYRSIDTGTKTVVRLELKKVERQPEGEAVVPKDFKRAARASDPLDGIIAGLDRRERPTKKAVLDFAEEAIGDERRLDALLALLEYTLQAEGRPFDEFKTYVKQVRDDEAVRVFLSSINGSKRGRKEAQEALKRLDGIDRKTIRKGYVLDVFRANLKLALGEAQEARKLFLAALEANPHLVGVYKDLGDLYYRSYEMDRAWRCWNTARRLDPEHPLLRPIAQLERQLEKTFPQYF